MKKMEYPKDGLQRIDERATSLQNGAAVPAIEGYREQRIGRWYDKGHWKSDVYVSKGGKRQSTPKKK